MDGASLFAFGFHRQQAPLILLILRKPCMQPPARPMRVFMTAQVGGCGFALQRLDLKNEPFGKPRDARRIALRHCGLQMGKAFACFRQIITKPRAAM